MKQKWWDRHSAAQAVKPPSKNTVIKKSVWFYQTTSFWHILFHARMNKKRVSDHLQLALWNKMIKLRRQFVQNDETWKRKFLSKLTMANRLYVNVNWETTFLLLWREELNTIFFFVIVNACSNISDTIPASFDMISIKISQFCKFNRS